MTTAFGKSPSYLCEFCGCKQHNKKTYSKHSVKCVRKFESQLQFWANSDHLHKRNTFNCIPLMKEFINKQEPNDEVSDELQFEMSEEIQLQQHLENADETFTDDEIDDIINTFCSNLKPIEIPTKTEETDIIEIPSIQEPDIIEEPTKTDQVLEILQDEIITVNKQKKIKLDIEPCIEEYVTKSIQKKIKSNIASSDTNLFYIKLKDRIQSKYGTVDLYLTIEYYKEDDLWGVSDTNDCDPNFIKWKETI